MTHQRPLADRCGVTGQHSKGGTLALSDLFSLLRLSVKGSGRGVINLATSWNRLILGTVERVQEIGERGPVPRGSEVKMAPVEEMGHNGSGGHQTRPQYPLILVESAHVYSFTCTIHTMT